MILSCILVMKQKHEYIRILIFSRRTRLQDNPDDEDRDSLRNVGVYESRTTLPGREPERPSSRETRIVTEDLNITSYEL
jgi:hypothetical protein